MFGALWAAGPAPAQEAVEPVGLPDVRELSAALAEPTSRTDTLLTLLAASRLLERIPAAETGAVADLVAVFRDERAWLDRLRARYADLPLRSPMLDPAAWFIQQELTRQGIQPPRELSPLGPDFAALSTQMFDRSDERLAAAYLPETLFHVETLAVPLWASILERAASSPLLAEVAAEIYPDWFEPWMAAEPPAPEHGRNGVQPIAEALERLQLMMYSLTLPEPPDELRTRRLRFALYQAMRQMRPDEVRTAAQILRLASALDGLYQGRHLEFIQTLLWVVTDLLDMQANDPDSVSPLPPLIADFLPRLSAAQSRQFNEIDPRLNANIAAAFDVAQELADGKLGPARLAPLQEELADAVAQLVLLAPDLAFYFDQPVRLQVSESIDACIGAAAARDDSERQVMTRQQFDGCVNALVSMVDSQLRSAELAGQPDGPYGFEQLRRELELMPWQRVNYLLGYLHEVAPTSCPAPQQPLPNPLEWSVLASLFSWFAAEAPVFLQTPQSEKLAAQMAQYGVDLMRAMSRQVDCISGSGTGVNDPVSESLSRYGDALDGLVGGIRNAEIAFRETRLKPGADVVLSGGVTQRTAYRTPDLAILPCDAERVCEMTQALDATRALVGLFPDRYLIADQTGLGAVEICYDDMQWIERRSEPVRPDDPNVANYFGRLTFTLLGRYREGSRVENIFGSRFVSPQEYHYLTAAADPQVLADGCPTEWVGSRVVTSRKERAGFSLVPDRLTYLAAARRRPSEVIGSNWARGAEWRDWFVTGIGVKPLEFELDPGLHDRLAAHLHTLYQAEQQAVYSALLRPSTDSGSAGGRRLNELLQEVTTYKTLLRGLSLLLYPQAMLDSEKIRSMLEGQNGLLDETVIRRFRSNGVPVGEIHDLGIDRLQQFQSIWSRQPDLVLRSGSVANGVAHAMARLNELTRRHFTKPADEAPPVSGAQEQPRR